MDGSWSCPSLLLMTSINGLTLVPLPSSADNELLHAHNPPLGTFHPWSFWDVLSDIHGRTHSFPLIHPRGVLLVWCNMDTRQSAHCGIFSISLLSGVGPSMVRLVHLSHAVHTPTLSGMLLSSSGAMRRSQLWWRTCDWSCFSFMMYEGRSFWLDVPLHMACPSINLWFFSFPGMNLPSLRQDHQASMKWCWFICCSTISVIACPLWIALGLPWRPLSDDPRGQQHIHWHTCAFLLLSEPGSRSQPAFWAIAQTLGNVGCIQSQLTLWSCRLVPSQTSCWASLPSHPCQVFQSST